MIRTLHGKDKRIMRNSSRRISPLLFLLIGLAGGVLALALLVKPDASAQKAPPSPVPSNVLVAEEIRLVDKAGKVRARVMPSTGDVGISLAIYHKDGKHMTVYRLGPEGLPGLDVLPIPKTE
jgi:hypothetical protein